MNANLRTKHIRQGGFSLLELLVVLGIIAILLSVSTLLLFQYLQQVRLNESVRQVAETLSRMGDDAIRNNYKVVIDEAILQRTGDTLRWTAGSDEVGRAVLPEGTNLAIINRPSVAALDFSSRGLPYRQLTFNVQRAGLSRQVVLLATGMVVQ